MADSGWNQLIELCCSDLEENTTYEFVDIQRDSTLLKYHIIRKMVTCFRVARLWERSWPLTQIQVQCNRERIDHNSTHEETFDRFVRRAVAPTIKDCLIELKRVKNSVDDAHDYMIRVSQLATPAYIRVPVEDDNDDEQIVFKAPEFEPYHHRNVHLTDIIFTCIKDVLSFNNISEITVDVVIDRVSFYQKMYWIFAQEFWPSYLLSEFDLCATSDSALHLIFSRLLKLELDDVNTCLTCLVKLFGF